MNRRPEFRISLWRRVVMLALNFLPLFHVALTAGVVVFPWNESLGNRVLAGVGTLYLLPPLAARVVALACPVREGRSPVGSGAFLSWWALSCLQTLFCRLPFLEEALRLVPGLYSAWLRLWGSKIGALTYWAPGTMILDRQFVELGDNVKFGAGVRINPHVIAGTDDGGMELILATVKIEDGAMIGGYSLLTAGTEIASGEATSARLLSPPYTRWEGGKRRSVEPSGESHGQ